MRVLFIYRSFADVMAQVARYIARNRKTHSVFMAEKWPRDAQISGLRMMRINGVEGPGVASRSGRGLGDDMDGRMLRNARCAARTADVCLRLRKGGFIPDVIYAAAEDGYGLYVADVFPEARLVTRADWFFRKEFSMTAFSTSKAPLSMETALGRMHNVFQLNALCQSSLGITSSVWQQNMFDPEVRGKIRVVANGVDTQLFHPGQERGGEEIVTFSCQGAHPARGIDTICQCLPELLELRPRCKVRILSFAAPRSDAGREQHEEVLAALLPPLPRDQRERLHLEISPPPQRYVELLQTSTVYVYLTAPFMLSKGLLEAMSCGVLTVASNTGPVQEIIRHGENGFLCDFWDAESLAQTVAHALEQAPSLAFIREQARQTVLTRYDGRVLLPKHVAMLLGDDLEPHAEGH